MPARPGLDDDESLKRLIDTWVSADNQLRAEMSDVGERILGELRSPDPRDPLVLRRLRVQEARIGSLLQPVDLILDDLREGTASWIGSGGLDRIYTAGANYAQIGSPFSFTLPHRAAVDALAQDLFDDVLRATDFVSQDHKRVIREASSQLSRLGLTTGQTPIQQARKFAHEVERHGIGFVTYKDGSKNPIGSYAEMLFRTKTGIAYNQAGINVAKEAGITYVEILDGSLCGLTSHNDGQLANGLIVPIEVAEAYPLAHPNCRRAIAPRAGIKKPSDRYKARSVQSKKARKDQNAFEAALRQQTRSRGFGDRARRLLSQGTQTGTTERTAAGAILGTARFLRSDRARNIAGLAGGPIGTVVRRSALAAGFNLPPSLAAAARLAALGPGRSAIALGTGRGLKNIDSDGGFR